MGELQPTTRRRAELSLANLAFCAMVLLLHILSDTIALAPPGTVFYAVCFGLWQLCSVAVYGFLFLSGLKSCLGQRRGLGDYYLRRVKTVLLPYLVWAVLYYLVRILLGHTPFSPLELLRDLLLGATASHLYFVVAVLQLYLLAPLWRAMVDRLSPVIVLPVLAAAVAFLPDALTVAWQRLLPGVPLYLDRVFLSYLFVWCAGCYAGAQYERFCALLRQNRWFLWGAMLCLLPLYLVCFYQNRVHNEWYSFLTALQQCYCTVAIGAVMVLAQAWQRLMRPWVMQALDRASYQIYLGHMLPLIGAPWAMRLLGVPALPWLQLLCRAGIVLVPTLGLCLLWQLRDRRSRPPLGFTK